MKLTHLTAVHPRYDTRIFHKHACFAAASGFNVTILVNDKIHDEVLNNVRINSTNAYFESKAKRILHSLFFFPFRALSIKSDLYVIHDPELIPCGIFLKFLRKKIIFDIHEDYNLVHFGNEVFLNSFLSFFYKGLSNFFIRHIDGVFVVNQRLFSQYLPIAKRLIVVPNYPILRRVNHKSKTMHDKKIRIIFAGGITEDWNIGRIASLLSDIEDVEFHVAGKFNAYLNSLLLNKDIKMIYHGQLKHDEVIELMVQMDMGIAFSSSIQLQGEGSIGNTKVFEYLASGLAVIVNDNQVWREVIEGNNLGFVLSKIEEIPSLLEEIRKNKHILEDKKIDSTKFIVEKYNWNLTYLDVLRLYKEVCNE